MDFDRLFDSWRSARAAGDVAAMEDSVRSARRLCSSIGAGGWDWFERSLHDEERKWFTAAVFKAQPVPKELADRMLRAGVLEKNPSFNRSFVEPCVKSFGATRVLCALLEYLQSGTDAEKAGAASALYWVPRQPGIDPDAELRQKIRCQMLREFVNNDDLEVRRRIIPMLVLDESKYPEDVRPFAAKAIVIARAHPDQYIRHRVEVQLGASGPFMAIPDANAGKK